MMPRTYMTGGETSESTNLKVLAACAAILAAGEPLTRRAIVVRSGINLVIVYSVISRLKREKRFPYRVVIDYAGDRRKAIEVRETPVTQEEIDAARI